MFDDCCSVLGTEDLGAENKATKGFDRGGGGTGVHGVGGQASSAESQL